MFGKLDDFIVNSTEQFCQMLQKNFGISLRILKIVAIVLYTFGSSITLVKNWEDPNKFFSSIVMAFVFLTLPLWMILNSGLHDKMTSTKPEQVANRWKFDPFYKSIRTIMYGFLLYVTICPFFPLLSEGLYYDIAIIVREFGYCSFWVLLACDPLPPQQSRLRKWVNSFGQVPEPVPIQAQRFVI